MFDPTTHSECVTNLRDETQISTQTSRSWLRFSSEYLSNNLMGGGQRPHPANSEFTQIFWVFPVYIADFWQTFWVIWENGSNWSNLRLKMSFFALGRLKNHKVPHLHPNSTMFMPLDRLQLKIYAFSGKFNVCSKRVLLSWIKICRDFTLQTQIFTQKYRSWLRFYSEFLRKNLAAEVSVLAKCLTKCYPCIIMGNWVTLVLAANEKVLIN